MQRARMLLGLGVLCLIATGCQSALHDENVKFRQQNLELQSRLDQETAKNRDLTAQLAAKDREIIDLKNAKPATPVAVAPPAKPTGLEDLDTSIDAKAGTLTVTIPGELLFKSGEAELQPASKATLDKVVAALQQQFSGKRVRVEGHTDTDKITRTKDKYDDNWDLSFDRAKHVMGYLIEKGVDPGRLSADACGEYHPKSPTDKKLNRRVQIVVYTR